MKCENKSINLERCNCSYPCPRKGICCECIASHRSQGQLPACYFSEKVEKTYDRSVANFLKQRS